MQLRTMEPLFTLSKKFKILKQKIKENYVDEDLYKYYVSIFANATI